MFRATKTYGPELGLSCAFRQWKADSHCRFLHGYALSVRLDFEAEHLDHRNWSMDFGSLKPVKQFLVDTFDHKTVIAADDPCLLDFETMHDAKVLDLVVLPAVGCEFFAQHIYDWVNLWLQREGYSPRVQLGGVEVREHGANAAYYEP